MFPAERISAIIEDARELESPDEKVVVGIRTALGSVEDDAFFDQAVEFFDGVASDEVRKALLEYLCRCVRGHEDALGRMVAVAPSRHAQYVLESLRSAGTSASRGAATRGLQSQHLDVILATLTGLDEDQALEARPMLRELVGSKEAGLRRKVIEAAVQRPVKALEPLLLERVQASTYQELPVRERRLLLEALASTNRPEAEVTAMSLLDKQQLIGGSSLDETRAVAADFLGGSSSELVLATLQRAAKKRWFGSEVVRETAERSANRVAERLRSGGQP